MCIFRIAVLMIAPSPKRRDSLRHAIRGKPGASLWRFAARQDFVPATLLSGAEGEGIWSVRYRPQGMSGGITLWGRPSAFTLPDGTSLPTLKAAN